MNTSLIFISILLLLIPSSVKHSSSSSSNNLSRTASLKARPHFDKGLLLLHNFEYPDAAEEFILAQREDPDFAMAYWGEAMTYDHPIWRDLNIEASRAALKKLGSTSADRVARGKTDLEKDFIQAVNILFGEGSKPDREKAYADFLGKLYAKYPTDHDVAAFYALSLLGIKKGWSEWEQYNVTAAEIVNKILKEDPNHAGALHYLVHADDHPRHAQEGLSAADKYAKVASYAGHALHMPSHIYLALGMWEDVVRSNEVAWQASLDRIARKNLSNDQLNFHAHLWLSYGYLQQGRFQRAKELIDHQIKFTNEMPSMRARIHLMEMKGHYLFHTNEWDTPLAEIKIKTEDLEPSSRYASTMLEGYKLFHQKKADDLRSLVAGFEIELAKAAKLQKSNDGIPICGVTRYANSIPTKNEVEYGERFLSQLRGLSAWLSSDIISAEKFLKEGLPKEGSVVVGPPEFLISGYELYGNFLLETNRPQEALAQFDNALAASPNRYVSLKGKLMAAKASKNAEAESWTKKQFEANLKNADQLAKKDLF